MANKQTPLPKKLTASPPPAPPTAEPLPPKELSAKAQPLAREAGLWHEVFNILGNATIKANQCLMAKEVLDRVQLEVTRAELELQKQLGAEEAELKAAAQQFAADAVKGEDAPANIAEAVTEAADPRPTAS